MENIETSSKKPTCVKEHRIEQFVHSVWKDEEGFYVMKGTVKGDHTTSCYAGFKLAEKDAMKLYKSLVDSKVKLVEEQKTKK
jgi:hypothetical protein